MLKMLMLPNVCLCGKCKNCREEKRTLLVEQGFWEAEGWVSLGEAHIWEGVSSFEEAFNLAFRSSAECEFRFFEVERGKTVEVTSTVLL